MCFYWKQIHLNIIIPYIYNIQCSLQSGPSRPRHKSLNWQEEGEETGDIPKRKKILLKHHHTVILKCYAIIALSYNIFSCTTVFFRLEEDFIILLYSIIVEYVRITIGLYRRINRPLICFYGLNIILLNVNTYVYRRAS